jgi:hypothetical protein
LESSDGNSSRSKSVGPGCHFRFATAWILGTLILYMLLAFLFDIILILRGINDLFVKKYKIHLDRFFCLMFSTNHGMGLFYHILFLIDCKKNLSCPSYIKTVWFIHLMPFWYSLIEFIIVPHNIKRDIKTTFFLPLILCLIYFINYWLYFVQTDGHYPYTNPWPVWRWISYFCIPLTIIYLRLLEFLREWLCYKELVPSWCIYPPRQFIEDPWIGWHQDFSSIDKSTVQAIDWKALAAMTFILLSIVAIWNISYLAFYR